MTNNRINFTKATLNSIEPPTSQQRIYFSDQQSRGLRLDILASGTKSFQVYRKVNGKPKRIVLGRFDASIPDSRTFPANQDHLTMIGNSAGLNVGMARKLCDAVNAALDRGEDPLATANERRRVIREELTLGGAFQEYYAKHLLVQGKASHLRIKDDFCRYLGKASTDPRKPRGKAKSKAQGSVNWENRPLSNISQTDIRGLMASIKQEIGKRTANRVLSIISAIYNKVITWEQYKGENPCARVEKFPENSRDRFLASAEIPKLLNALNALTDIDFKHFVLLSLFTACRQSNVLGMRWADINYDASILTIQKEVSKNGTQMTIPLTGFALEVLSERKKTMNSDSPFVFPAKSASGHMTPPKKRWKQLLAQAGIEDLRMHDLRRSLASWAAMSGTSLPIIGKMLGHNSAQATEIYARLQADPVKNAMQTATKAMLDTMLQTYTVKAEA
ncbi:tyrosine-type recombinase/integrase [Undibacterium sp. SXout7W]|uniref:tyrosine-type recombinase/integrase n=1 Tax=Undibacterium sp. SXout7W TaxID=3413049 RepID=UPI003BF06155